MPALSLTELERGTKDCQDSRELSFLLMQPLADIVDFSHTYTSAIPHTNKRSDRNCTTSTLYNRNGSDIYSPKVSHSLLGCYITQTHTCQLYTSALGGLLFASLPSDPSKREREIQRNLKEKSRTRLPTRSGTCLLLPSTPSCLIYSDPTQQSSASTTQYTLLLHLSRQIYNITCVCVYKYVCMYQVQLAFRYTHTLCISRAGWWSSSVCSVHLLEDIHRIPPLGANPVQTPCISTYIYIYSLYPISERALKTLILFSKDTHTHQSSCLCMYTSSSIDLSPHIQVEEKKREKSG